MLRNRAAKSETHSRLYSDLAALYNLNLRAKTMSQNKPLKVRSRGQEIKSAAMLNVHYLHLADTVSILIDDVMYVL